MIIFIDVICCSLPQSQRGDLWLFVLMLDTKWNTTFMYSLETEHWKVYLSLNTTSTLVSWQEIMHSAAKVGSYISFMSFFLCQSKLGSETTAEEGECECFSIHLLKPNRNGDVMTCSWGRALHYSVYAGIHNLISSYYTPHEYACVCGGWAGWMTEVVWIKQFFTYTLFVLHSLAHYWPHRAANTHTMTVWCSSSRSFICSVCYLFGSSSAHEPSRSTQFQYSTYNWRLDRESGCRLLQLSHLSVMTSCRLSFLSPHLYSKQRMQSDKIGRKKSHPSHTLFSLLTTAYLAFPPPLLPFWVILKSQWASSFPHPTPTPLLSFVFSLPLIAKLARMQWAGWERMSKWNR